MSGLTKKLPISAEEVFADLDKKYSKAGALLRGARLREELTQKQLAARLGMPHRHISAMEHGKRPIDRKMALKLAKALRTSAKIFL